VIEEQFVLRHQFVAALVSIHTLPFKLAAFTYREIAMRIYVFKSETTDRVRAFAGDPDVNKLPSQHGPWTVTGTITPDNAPPYNLSRDAIEKAINAEGFQLWRLREKK